MSLQYIHCTWIGVKTKQNNQVGIMNLMSHRTLRAWRWMGKETEFKSRDTRSYNARDLRTTKRLGFLWCRKWFSNRTQMSLHRKKDFELCFCVRVCVFFRLLSKSYRAKCVQLKIRTELPYSVKNFIQGGKESQNPHHSPRSSTLKSI